ncbi:LPS assembly lipoprotein LptE [Paracoccus aminophilus]|nr:LPS assembly lipoprotein LptE [Paracoccus aminophilus]
MFGKVRSADPKTMDDFAFVRRVTERLGPAQDATYDLDYKLLIAVVPQAITPNEITTRYALNGSAEFTLRDSATGKIVTRGQVNNFTSYSTTGTTIATMAAEQDAHDRLAFMLADQVVTRIYGVASL